MQELAAWSGIQRVGRTVSVSSTASQLTSEAVLSTPDLQPIENKY